MNKSLLIIAHPNKESFSHILAQDYKEEKEKIGHEIRTIDLYEPKRRQDYLELNETNRTIDDPLRIQHQQEISWADEICFFFPLRRFDCPAILKNRFDTNYTAGFAYKYRSGKAIPERLLKGKRVRIIVTTGGPRWLYKTLGWMIITLPRYLGRINYVGMRLASRTWITDMNTHKTIESRKDIREKIRSMVKR